VFYLLINEAKCRIFFRAEGDGVTAAGEGLRCPEKRPGDARLKNSEK
jgi:hypothetical protein